MRKLNEQKKGKQKRPAQSNGSNQDTEHLSRYQRWQARAKGLLQERLMHESKRMIVIKFFIAPILCMIAALLLFLFLDFDTFTKVGGLMLVYFVPPAGKETVIPTGVFVFGINPLLMAFSIAFVDIVTAIFLLWNYDYAKLIPFVGEWMDKVEKKGGKQFQENVWLEGLAFFGLVLFVIFPFQGSGGVGASIVGRVVGMDKYKVVYAVTIGALSGCVLIAYISEALREFFIKNLILGIIFFIIIVIIIAIYLIYKKNKNKDETN